jgi:hypothetical protein
MCPNESISIPEGLDVNSKNPKSFQDPFVVQIKVKFQFSKLNQIKHLLLFFEYFLGK